MTKKTPRDIKDRFTQLRVVVRKNGSSIIKNLSDRNLGQIGLKIPICCSFCGATESLTREHVVPRWVFESESGAFYIHQTNLQPRRYIEATVPACRTCNNEILGDIERHIHTMLSTQKVGTRSYGSEDYENIIRWLEIINYKFKVHDLNQRFLAHKKAGMIPALKDFSLAVMMHGVLPWFQVQVNLRGSLKMISVKKKGHRVGSLIFAATKNKKFHFFNSDNFIFLELPQHGLALFYFYLRRFRSEKSSHKAMKRVLDHAYGKSER